MGHNGHTVAWVTAPTTQICSRYVRGVLWLAAMPPIPTIRERYPLPWAVERTPGGFAIVDARGKRLAFLYVKHHASMDGLTAGEASAIATRLVAVVNGAAVQSVG